MAYTPTTWNDGDVITKEKLNKLEQGVQNEQVGPAGKDGKDGAKGDTGAAAGFGTVTVTVDSGTSGSPTCVVTPSGPDTAKNFTLAFHNLKGANGAVGAAAGFGTPTASVDANTGTPSVTVTASGPNTAKVFNFAFKNLKGATGAAGPTKAATTGEMGAVKMAAKVADAAGDTVTKAEFNALLSALKAAGIMSST